jgi:hypothetical protein
MRLRNTAIMYLFCVFFSGDASPLPAFQRHLLAVLRQPSYAHNRSCYSYLAALLEIAAVAALVEI